MKIKLAYNTLTSLLMQLVTVICGLILPKLILTQYGSEVNGLCQSIAQFLGLISFMEMGIGQVIKSALYEPLVENDRQQISRVIASGSRYFKKIVYALIVYVIILILLYPSMVAASFDWTFTATLICAMCFSNFAQYCFGVVDGILLSANQRGYIQNITNIVTTVLNVILCTILIKLKVSIQLVKLVSSLVFLLRPIILRIYVKNKYFIDRKITYQQEPITQKWNGIAQHISAVVLERTDSVVLTLFSTLTYVSVYSVYYMVISGIVQIYTALTSGLPAIMGQLWTERDMKKLTVLFNGTETLLHGIVVFLFSCVMGLMLPFVQVYTNGIQSGEYMQPVFSLLLSVAYAVRCLRTPYNMIILAGGHFKQTQRCHIVAAVVNLLLSIAGVRKWGLIGIAFGTFAAMAYQTTWMAYYTSRYLLRRSFVYYIRHILVDVIIFTLVWYATQWIELTTVSYMGWFIMALQVAGLSFAITTLVTMACFGKDIKMMLQRTSG